MSECLRPILSQYESPRVGNGVLDENSFFKEYHTRNDNTTNTNNSHIDDNTDGNSTTAASSSNAEITLETYPSAVGEIEVSYDVEWGECTIVSKAKVDEQEDPLVESVVVVRRRLSHDDGGVTSSPGVEEDDDDDHEEEEEEEDDDEGGGAISMKERTKSKRNNNNKGSNRKGVHDRNDRGIPSSPSRRGNIRKKRRDSNLEHRDGRRCGRPPSYVRGSRGRGGNSGGHRKSAATASASAAGGGAGASSRDKRRGRRGRSRHFKDAERGTSPGGQRCRRNEYDDGSSGADADERDPPAAAAATATALTKDLVDSGREMMASGTKFTMQIITAGTTSSKSAYNGKINGSSKKYHNNKKVSKTWLNRMITSG